MTAHQALAMSAIIARVLVEPDLLDALERHDTQALRRGLTADPAELDALSAVDVRGLRAYQRLLQRKRLEVIEPLFPASLPAARAHYGVDGLAAGFWRFYRQPDTVPVHDLHGEVAAAWARYAGLLSGDGVLPWLEDLSRYELMRFRAVFDAQLPPRPGAPQDMRGDMRPVLVPGAGVAAFAFDVPVLLRSLLDGHTVAKPQPRATRLVVWHRPEGGIGTVRLGASAYAVLLACDGSRTTDRIAEGIGIGGIEASGTATRDRVVALVGQLVQVGVLHLAPMTKG